MPNNTELFETLHADYYPMVNQMCLGFMKGNKALAQDLSQETFINTWRALDKFKGASSYKTWIYRITVNTCLKYIRDNKLKNQASIDEYTQLPDDSTDTEQEHQALYHAIGQLGEVDRLIIMMVLDELEYGEIAEVVGISEGNLRVKIHRIKKSLKKILV
ncbi:RNA polymerase sigma-70 factor, ECF subfamily [Ekhidna lutea]|uniref:RNA polymerase sigma-70 factor, ECF subfamily n=1 Tax=Ekhidna lutea TaxID=447679 RepID=A0A239LEQ0_EKHLU|nr:sigma-70 family RNA polymerase sigma factor [Ekhidna lutea]SNT28109.1 RNA polymerase sigma-70 factor, ECF subfamily [Ekhidna lutea]